MLAMSPEVGNQMADLLNEANSALDGFHKASIKAGELIQKSLGTVPRRIRASALCELVSQVVGHDEVGDLNRKEWVEELAYLVRIWEEVDGFHEVRPTVSQTVP
jgi:hypothetical protein